jgi:hypothetical protein
VVGSDIEKELNTFMFKPSESLDDKTRGVVYKRIIKMLDDFNKYCKSVPVLRFNNSRYDIQLGRGEIVKHLNICDNNCFVIKRNNAYVCIASDKYRILDVTNYLQQGTSYA